MITLGCIWLAVVVHPVHVERNANLAIAHLGGAVVYDYEVDLNELADRHVFHALSRRRVNPPGPRWLVRIVGEEYFERIVAVDLRDREVGRGDLEAIAKLKELRYLNLYGATLSEDATQALAKCESLEELSLDDTSVNDVSIQPLLALRRLRILGLARTRVTDAGLKRMKGNLTSGLCNLERLDLESCDVTDDGIAWLVRQVPPLHVLDLRETQVTEAGVRRVREAWPGGIVYEP